MATTGHKLLAAGTAVLIAEPALALAHTGGIGVIVGLAAGAVAYCAVEDLEKLTGREGSSRPVSPRQAQETGKRSLAYRLLNGKSTREQESFQDEQRTEPRPKNGSAQTQAQSSSIPAQFLLDDCIHAIDAANEQGYIYFGESAAGSVYVKLDDMYHVLDVSSSGKGKSNRFRLAMIQLVSYCETYYINPLAAPVKSVKDSRKVEVWQPIYDRLANQRPIRSGPEILQLMTALVNEIQRRSERENARDFAWQDHPIFVFIDELPEVSSRCKEAIELLDKIGRMGRQFCVFAWVASQTAAVADIGLSTASQAQFKTRIYGGGDRTSSGRLMKESLPMNTERLLQTSGAGLTVMLADGLSELAFVRAPLVTNEGLFQFLGLGVFDLEEWLTAPAEKTTRRQPEPSPEPFPETPLQGKRPNVAPVASERSFPESPRSLPEDEENEPVEPPEFAPDEFLATPDDLLLSELQAELLVALYHYPGPGRGNVNKSLEQIKNDKGQSLGGRYYRHASWILEQRGLKKRRG